MKTLKSVWYQCGPHPSMKRTFPAGTTVTAATEAEVAEFVKGNALLKKLLASGTLRVVRFEGDSIFRTVQIGDVGEDDIAVTSAGEPPGKPS